MNCLEAEALISAAHDGERVSETDLAAAQAHCDECPDCTAFTDGLRWLDVMPVPPAPDGLVERVLAAVAPLQVQRAEALALEAEKEETAGAGLELPVPDEEIVEDAAEVAVPPAKRTLLSRFEWFQGPTKWASLGAAGALAATALIAFVVVGLGGSGQTPQTASTANLAAPEVSFSDAGQKAAPTVGAQQPAPTAPAQAPDYVL
ncbi:MAG TPA: hypothetical protein VIJ45_04355, partial [Coriobacteriia bacterium]